MTNINDITTHLTDPSCTWRATTDREGITSIRLYGPEPDRDQIDISLHDNQWLLTYVDLIDLNPTLNPEFADPHEIEHTTSFPQTGDAAAFAIAVVRDGWDAALDSSTASDYPNVA